MTNFERIAEKMASVEIKFELSLDKGNRNPWATYSTSKEQVEFYVDNMDEAKEFLDWCALSSREAPISKSYEITDSEDDQMGGILVTAIMTTTVWYN